MTTAAAASARPRGAKRGASAKRRKRASNGAGASADEVAAQLREPTRRAGVSLERVAAQLREPTRRAGVSLERVAAQLREPAREERAATDVAMPKRAVALELIAGRTHYERVIAAVLAAHTSVWIASANVKELMVDDGRAVPGRRRRLRRSAYVSVLARLDELAARGVELRLLHAEIPSRPFRAELARRPRLVRGGLELRRCPRVHLKVVVVDGETLYLGSANWTGAGLGAKGTNRRNFELGIVTDDGLLLDEVQSLYERIWSGRECAGCKLRELCPGPLDEGGADAERRDRGP